MKFSLKKPKSLFWRTDYSLAEVQKKLAVGKITGDWLVCPLGEAERAVPVSEFIARPAMFDPVPEADKPPPPAADQLEVSAPLPSIDRRHDLDALRATAMLLGIALHGALAYATLPWVVNDSRQDAFFDTFFSAVHGFRMPLFFMISGFFTAMLWRKRGLSSLIKQRAKRILLPLAIFLIPIQIASIAVMIGIGIAGASLDGGHPAPDTLWIAARDNHVDALEKHLESVGDINQRDPQHQNPALNWAALNGSLEAVEWLIEKGADVNVRSGDQTTPVSCAAFTGRAEVVKLLIENGADLNTVNQYQATALDNVNADYGIVEWVAGALGLQVDKKSVEEGRKAAAELLRENGGKQRSDLRRGNEVQADSDGVNDHQLQLGGITVAYLSFTDSRVFQELQIFGHLWFLWFLCILIVPFGAYAMIADNLKWAGPPKWLFLSPVLLFWLVPVTMIPQWFHGLRGPPVFGPDTSLAVFPFPHIVLLYAVYFFFGALYFDCDDKKGKLGRFWWLTLPVALFVVYPLGMSLTFEPESAWMANWIPDSALRPAAVTMQALFAWLMIFGMMGLFRKLCARENKAVRYISDSSYWLYLMHIPLVFVAQYLVKSLDLPAFVKFAIVCVSLTAVLLLIYDLVVRYTVIGTLLNGKRTRPQ